MPIGLSGIQEIRDLNYLMGEAWVIGGCILILQSRVLRAPLHFTQCWFEGDEIIVPADRNINGDKFRLFLPPCETVAIDGPVPVINDSLRVSESVPSLRTLSEHIHQFFFGLHDSIQLFGHQVPHTVISLRRNTLPTTNPPRH